MATEGRADRRTHRQQTARHAFTDVVVGIPGQVELNAAGVPHAEALACGAAEVGFNRIRRQALIAMRLGNVAGERCAHRTVGVANIKPEGFALTLVHERLRLIQQLGVEHAVIKRRVVLGAVKRFARMRLGGLQQLRQIQLLLFGSKALQRGKQIGTANQVHQAGHAQLRHQLPGLTGDKFKVVGHFERQAVIVVLTQLVILGCNAGCAVVQVANTQVFTAQRHHRAGAEAEALCTQNRRFDDVYAGFQAAVDLQTDLVTQAVRYQRLLGLNQPQLPRAARVFH